MCTEACGQLQPPDEPELIEAFGTAINDAFAFLGPEYGLEPAPICALAITKTGTTPVDRAEAVYPLLAVQEFTGTSPPIRITYGDRDYHLTVESGPTTPDTTCSTAG